MSATSSGGESGRSRLAVPIEVHLDEEGLSSLNLAELQIEILNDRPDRALPDGDDREAGEPAKDSHDVFLFGSPEKGAIPRQGVDSKRPIPSVQEGKDDMIRGLIRGDHTRPAERTKGHGEGGQPRGREVLPLYSAAKPNQGRLMRRRSHEHIAAQQNEGRAPDADRV